MEAFPLKTTTNKDMAELINMFARVGIPEEILTNSGTNVCSKLMIEFYSLFWFKPIQTLAYHAEMDRMSVRYNSTLKSGLWKYFWQIWRTMALITSLHVVCISGTPSWDSGVHPFQAVLWKEPQRTHGCTKGDMVTTNPQHREWGVQSPRHPQHRECGVQSPRHLQHRECGVQSPRHPQHRECGV